MSTIGHLFYHDTLEVFEETSISRVNADEKFLGFDLFIVGDSSKDYTVEETDTQWIVSAKAQTNLIKELGDCQLIVDKVDIVNLENDTDGLVIQIIGGSTTAKRIEITLPAIS